MTYSIETGTLKFATGRSKKVTRVIREDGKKITFMDKLGKSEAIKCQ